jgi:hypothetical protein
LRSKQGKAKWERSESNVPILVLVLLVDAAHKRRSGWQDFIDENEDRFLRGKLNALADNIDELTDGEVGGYQVLLLVDSSDIALLNLLAYDRNTIRVLLSLWKDDVRWYSRML